MDPVTLVPGMVPLTRVDDGALMAEVLWVDRYGNAQLNVDPDEIAGYGERVRLQWSGGQTRTARRVATYADLKPGEVGLVVDSYGLVSVALDRRSASAELKLRPSDAVILDEPPA